MRRTENQFISAGNAPVPRKRPLALKMICGRKLGTSTGWLFSSRLQVLGKRRACGTLQFLMSSLETFRARGASRNGVGRVLRNSVR